MNSDESILNMITHLNAMRLFGFEPFAHRERASATIDALRAEASDVDTFTRVGRAPDESDRDYFRGVGTHGVALSDG